MKRINLVPKEPMFPLSKTLQRRIVYPVILLIIAFHSNNFYKARKELININSQIAMTKTDIENIKKSITEKSGYLEKSSVIEKEFLAIQEDYNILKKNTSIKKVFESLTEIVPPNLWLTNINYQDNDDRFINLSGKSYNKEAIFLFLNNCSNIGNTPELISIDKEDENLYNFTMKIEML